MEEVKAIKFLKKEKIQLDGMIYKPYKVCNIPDRFGCHEFNERDKYIPYS